MKSDGEITLLDYVNPNASSYKTYFYQALRKYGHEQFSFEVIEECKEEDLDTREMYWIKTLQSNNREIGYNTTDGGDGVKGYWDKVVYQYDLEGNFIAEYKSASEAERQTGISTIGCACVGITKSGGGYMWSYTKADKIPKCVRNHRTTEVHQYSLDGEYIQSFPSILEASRVSGVNKINIRSCANSDRQIRAGDYMWTNKKVDKLAPYKRVPGRITPPILQMDIDGNEIARYENLEEASKATGNSKNNIGRCCNGRVKISGGYRWKFII